jgi:hypothetical protein
VPPSRSGSVDGGALGRDESALVALWPERVVADATPVPSARAAVNDCANGEPPSCTSWASAASLFASGDGAADPVCSEAPVWLGCSPRLNIISMRLVVIDSGDPVVPAMRLEVDGSMPVASVPPESDPPS